MMRRAVVIYLENTPQLMMLFGCLYTSLKYIQSPDTDLVVFGPHDALNKIPQDCIKVEFPPLTSTLEWQSHRWINSIAFLTDSRSEFLEQQYDRILRTDVDTFLTPAWNSFYPQKYSVGLGGYAGLQEVRDNIKRVARELGWQHRDMHDIGASHYGPPSQVREVCRLAMHAAAYLMTNEFHQYEGTWPGWYKGVLTMYSAELAVNHLFESVSFAREQLDCRSDTRNPVSLHPHIHCWHTDHLFSKFQFVEGKYDHLSLEGLNLDIVSEYCLAMALRSRKEMPWLANG